MYSFLYQFIQFYAVSFRLISFYPISQDFFPLLISFLYSNYFALKHWSIVSSACCLDSTLPPRHSTLASLTLWYCCWLSSYDFFSSYKSSNLRSPSIILNFFVFTIWLIKYIFNSPVLIALVINANQGLKDQKDERSGDSSEDMQEQSLSWSHLLRALDSGFLN